MIDRIKEVLNQEIEICLVFFDLCQEYVDGSVEFDCIVSPHGQYGFFQFTVNQYGELEIINTHPHMDIILDNLNLIQIQFPMTKCPSNLSARSILEDMIIKMLEYYPDLIPDPRYNTLMTYIIKKS